MADKQSVFDIRLFKRLLSYTKSYKLVFGISLITVVGLAVFGALRPKVVQLALDSNIETQIVEGFFFYIMLMLCLLVLETICNLLFIYYATWLGQSVVKDIRVKLFNRVMRFKMAYYDKS